MPSAENVVSLEQGVGEPQQSDARIHAEEADLDKRINNRQFINDIQQLRDLSSFMNNEAIPVVLSDRDMEAMGELFTLSLGESLLSTRGYRGRAPTASEWAAVAKYNQMLFPLLSESQRRRFLLGRISVGFARLPFVLPLVPLFSLLGSVFIANVYQQRLGVRRYS